MAARKQAKKSEPQLVRRSLTVDPAKLEKARKLLQASSDAEALRLALDRVLVLLEAPANEEE